MNQAKVFGCGVGGKPRGRSEMVSEANARELEVAVIGAGQSGLAMGYLLSRTGTAVRDP